MGWLGERLARLKLNGRIVGYSPLSRLVELEALATGIQGLQLGEPPRLEVNELERLLSRARSQLRRVEELHGEAAAAAFS